MLITRKPRSAHWYLPDGTPYYEVPNASKPGLMRPTTIRDAFKAGAYRSVTSVLDIVAKPGLVDWKIEQAILSALTLPRIDGEPVSDFAMRALEDSEEQSAQAREMGTKLHDCAEKFMTTGDLPADPELARLFMPFIDWAGQNIKRVIHAEKVVVNHWHQYAGRLDLAVELVDGRLAVIDIKSQDVKLDKKGQPKAEFYDEWPLQLAAYAACQMEDTDGRPIPGDNWSLISLVIDRTRPGVYPKDWKLPENLLAANADFFEVFMGLCDSWSYFKGGTPGKDKQAA